ncbi:PH domain-containing protein [Cryptococcus neoformans Ze90-1]|nr:PH domain-containing protein [Cryptococcus neoformans var. grubii Ze90-1]
MSGPQQQPIPAPPPSQSEIERKLSFRSTVPPRPIDSPKKPRKLSHTLPHSALSGNDSDSSIASSIPTQSIVSPNASGHPTSPLLTPATTSAGGLSAIAENKFGGDEEIVSMMELEDVEEEEEAVEGAESASEDEEAQDELQRGMEGQRVVMSGYLYKKQEKRRAWKKRWFVLRNEKLAYYKDDKEYSLKRVINLREIHTVAPVVIKKHPNTFGIVVPKRTFFVKAPSVAEMDEWVHAINEMRRRISEKEEEAKRDHHPKSMSVSRNPPTLHSIDTVSPTNTTYMGPIVSSPQPTILSPSSPIDNNLTSRFAKISLPARSPSNQSIHTLQGSHIPSGISNIASRGVSGPSKREASTGSMSSADHLRNVRPPASSEDEDELETPVAPADPKKVILSAYLMKQSKRRKDVWRKRWFVLTSSALAYSRSHMETKAQQVIPLSSILDALEVLDPASDGNESDRLSAHGHTHPVHSHSHHSFTHAQSPTSSSRQFMRGRLGSNPTSADTRLSKDDEHIFRLITAKRTFHLCAPTEEDEIKWLAAFRALLEQQRGERSASFNVGGSSAQPNQQAQSSQGQGKRMTVPVITQQPPTPGLSSSVSLNSSVQDPMSASSVLEPPIPASGVAPLPPLPSGSQATSTPTSAQSQSQTQQSQPQDPPSAQSQVHVGGVPPSNGGQRGRSATYTAKSAVADVVRRFHAEKERET